MVVGMRSRGQAWQGVCMTGGVRGRGSMSRRYASFLFQKVNVQPHSH